MKVYMHSQQCLTVQRGHDASEACRTKRSILVDAFVWFHCDLEVQQLILSLWKSNAHTLLQIEL